jgi:hypothetical protein
MNYDLFFFFLIFSFYIFYRSFVLFLLYYLNIVVFSFCSSTMLYNYITIFFYILFAIHIHTCEDYEERQCIKIAFSIVLAKEKTTT